ncbi:hypothetical protein, partial [Neisseria sp.]|uniref:hypothetical protein n=1 Tax=Neisseria sp. TaxID=192066 RepID=UPI0026DD7750
NFVLFTAGFYDRVHTQLHKGFGSKYPRTMREAVNFMFICLFCQSLFSPTGTGRLKNTAAAVRTGMIAAIIARCIFFFPPPFALTNRTRKRHARKPALLPTPPQRRPRQGQCGHQSGRTV